MSDGMRARFCVATVSSIREKGALFLKLTREEIAKTSMLTNSAFSKEVKNMDIGFISSSMSEGNSWSSAVLGFYADNTAFPTFHVDFDNLEC